MNKRGPLPPWMQKYGLESKRLNDDHVPARGVFRRPKVQGNTIGIKVPHQHQSIAWSKHYPVGRSSEYSGGKVRHTPVPKGVSGLQKGLKGQLPPESASISPLAWPGPHCSPITSTSLWASPSPETLALTEASWEWI